MSPTDNGGIFAPGGHCIPCLGISSVRVLIPRFESEYDRESGLRHGA